jgi:hypothetical protein
MKKYLLTVVTVVSYSLFTPIFSQYHYAYYQGYESGFHKACGCSNQIPNASQKMNINGTWDDGYNAGYTDGRIFLNQNSSNIPSTPELYKPDFNQIYNVMAQKQMLLDQRRALIQQKYDEVREVAFLKKQLRSPQVFTQAEQEYLVSFETTANKYGNYDLSNTSIFNQVMNWLQENKTYVLSW